MTTRHLRTKIVRSAVALLVLMIATPRPASAEEIYISNKGPSATVTKMDGRGTSNATLEARVSEIGAREYCERDPGGMTGPGRLTVDQCIRQTVDQDWTGALFASADCDRGLLRDTFGRTLQYVGRSEYGSPRWFDLDEGEEVGSCGACNDAASSSQFEIMCPFFQR